MNNAADAIASILDLAQVSNADKKPEDEDYRKAVEKYGARMMPRAFRWVMTGGGLGGDVSFSFSGVLMVLVKG